MRILVVSHVFWPETFRINDLTAELVRRGHDVTVLTGTPNYPEGRTYPEYLGNRAAYTRFHGAPVVRVPIVPRGKGRLQLVLNYLSFVVSGSLVGAWRLRGQKFDAIFVWESSPVTVGLPAIVLRWLKRAPIVFWVLDLWPDTLEALGILRKGVALNAVGRLVTFIYRHCDLILAQSRSFIPEINRYSRVPGKVRYFPSWAEAAFSSAASVTAATEIPDRAGSFDVMFAGNIGEAQDFPAILAAAERLRDHPRVRWLVVGDGSMAAWVKAEIIRRRLERSVLMLGRHPVERMPAFYRRAQALLVSLRPEPIFSMTIPGKLQSYLAAGVPIVAMLDGEGADVVNRAKAGVTCAAGNSAQLAAAVSSLAETSAAELAEMGRNAAALSAHEFNRDVQIDQLERWLAQLVSGLRGAELENT